MIARSYRVLQHLSIDIVFGAVILLHFFSKIYGISPSWSTYVLLGSTVWIIYTLDHLRDSKVAESGRRERYVFHSTNELALKIGTITVTVLSMVCLFFVPISIIAGGSVLVVLCAVYVFFQQTLAKLGLKELYISIVYTAGILLVPIVTTQSFHWYSFVLLFIITFLNLIIFSWFECEDDQADSFQSIAIRLEKSGLSKLILVVLSIGFALGFLAITALDTYVLYLLLVLMIFVFLVLNETWAKVKDRYRAIGDGVFLLPILIEFL